MYTKPCSFCNRHGHTIADCPDSPHGRKRLPDLESARDRHKAEEEVNNFDQKGFWKKVGRLATRLPFIRTAVAMFYCMLDPGTPLKVKAAIVGALAYFVLPLDLIPDFIPIAGYGDDAGVVMTTYMLVKDHVTVAHYAAADRKLGLIRA